MKKPLNVNTLEDRLRRAIALHIQNAETKNLALDDVQRLANEVRELRVQLMQHEPVEPVNVRSRIESNARKVNETAREIIARFGVK